jgi:hypothetical protein
MSVLAPSRTSHKQSRSPDKTQPETAGLEVQGLGRGFSPSSTFARPELQEVRPRASSRLATWWSGFPRFGLLLFVGDVTAFLATGRS